MLVCMHACVCVHAWDPENVYTSAESNDVHGDKPHLIPEWSVILVSLLERMQRVSGVLDVAGQAGSVALQPVVSLT